MRSATAMLALLLISGFMAGCMSGSESPTQDTIEEPAPLVPQVVIGLQDNGINVYHAAFRDDSPVARQYPGEYLPDYPEGAVALELSLDASDFWSAVRADCEAVWSTIEPGQLYWFPGTKIVGAITFDAAPDPNCNAEEPSVPGILGSSHGTMTASRAAGTEYGACKECRIVMVEGFNTEGVAWLGENARWIDAQSHSWGPFLPLNLPGDVAGLTSSPEFVRAVEASAQKNLAFWASGNGLLTRFGVLGHPTLLTPHFGPSVIPVGGHDSGYINTWPGFWPRVVSDSCNSWAAHHTNMTSSADNVGGGTSGATPFAAGGAGRILLTARTLLGDAGTGVHDGVVARGDPGAILQGPLTDGEFTLEEWRTLLFHTASARPERQFEDGSVCSLGSGLLLYDTLPVEWSQVPEGYPEHLHIGYGAVDNRSMEFAEAVLRGEAEAPDRSSTDGFFALDATARAAIHQAYTNP